MHYYGYLHAFTQKTDEHAKLIGVILTQAEKEMIVKYNAYSKSKVSKSGSKAADYFETEEIIYILKWQVIMHLLIILGGRRGEIAGLRFEKINWDNHQLRLDTNLLYNGDDGVYVDTTKSSLDNRYMPLPAQTWNCYVSIKNGILN